MLNNSGYVSSTVKRLKKRLAENPDEKEAYKNELKSVVSVGVQDFGRRLRSGEVKITTVADFERLAKLGLLLHGEATERVEETTDIEVIETERLEALQNTEEFEVIKQRLFDEMSKKNEGV